MSYAGLQSDTAYHGSHSRSHSETRVSSDREVLMNPAEGGFYDPHTRTGRPSFAHSAQNSPHMGPTIHVGVHNEPEKLQLDRGFDQGNQPPHKQIHGPSTLAKIMARLRFLLLLFIFIASAFVIGVNAAIYVTWAKHRDTIKWTDQHGKPATAWPVWPNEGIDIKPISAYIGVAGGNALVILLLLLLSFRKSFRYAESVATEIVLMIIAAGFFVGWLLVSLLLQYQATGHSDHHSFLTWTCTHTGSMFAVESFSFANLCNLSHASRIGGSVLGGLNALLFITVLLGCCTQRKTRGYAQLSGGRWMPKWGRSRK